MNKISTLYPLIKALHFEDNRLLNSYKITEIQHENREYILIKFKNHFAEQAHFSIDKFYDPTQKTEHGLTPLHYTLTYNGNTIHGYLDIHGKFLYAKIKQNAAQKVTKTQKKVLKEKLKAHLIEHKPFIDSILAEKKKRKKQTKEIANNLEYTLTQLSYTLDQESSRKEYLQIAAQFSKAVQDFNQYSKNKDVRDKPVLRTFKKIQIIQTCFESENKKNIDSPKRDIKHDNNTDDTYLLPETNSIHELYNFVTTTFFKIATEFKEIHFDSKSAPAKAQLASQLEEQILLIYSFPPKIVTKKNEHQIQTIFTELNIYYTQCVDLLKQITLSGDLESLSTLFPVLKKYLPKDFYIKFTKPLQEKLIPIYDFLYKNDPNYRAFILNLTLNAQFPASITEAQNILENGMFYAQRVGVSTSLLYKLYSKNEFSLFEMLLRHGACANEWGIKLQTNKIHNLSLTLFYSIVHGKKDDKNIYRYLRLLLQYQADPNETYTKTSQLSYTKQVIQDYHDLKKFSLIDKRNFSVSVVTLAMKQESEALNIVLNTASVSNLACALGHHLLNEEKVTTVHALNKNYGIYFFNSAPCAPRIVEAPIMYVAYNCHTSEDMAVKMTLIQSKIKEKISSLRDDEFKKEYDTLLKYAQTKFKIQNIEDAFPAFLGCEFLLMTRCFSLHSQPSNQTQFLKTHGIQSLYDSIIELVVEMGINKFGTLFILSLKTINKYAYPEIPCSQEFKTPHIDEPFSTKKNVTENNDAFEDTISPICVAARNGNIEKLRLLLKKFPDNIDKAPPNAKGWTALHYACATAQIPCVKLLILSGANIFIKNDNEKIAFHANILKDQSVKQELEALFFNTLANTKSTRKKITI